MASYDKSKDSDYTLAVQSALKSLGADLGRAGLDGKWGQYTQNAYQQNKQAVDQIVQSVNQRDDYGIPALNTPQIPHPPTRSYSDLYSTGLAMYAAQYEAQKSAANNQFKRAQEQLNENRVSAKSELSKAAAARGFGRSSYVVDAMQNTEKEAARNHTFLEQSLSETLMQLENNRQSAASSYAAGAMDRQQEALWGVQQTNAQMMQQANLAKWQAQTSAVAAQQKQTAKSSSSSSRSSKKTSAGATITETPSASIKKSTASITSTRYPMGVLRAEGTRAR